MGILSTVDTPCREWAGARIRGYGVLYREGRNWLVHRWVWRLMHGPIPEGMHVLHHCDNPPCFRLDHLFLGDRFANMQDASAKGRLVTGRNQHTGQTHCKRGHEFTPENTYISPSGGRTCRRCRGY